MVVLAQLVRAPDCGSGGRGFEPHILPSKASLYERLFLFLVFANFYKPLYLILYWSNKVHIKSETRVILFFYLTCLLLPLRHLVDLKFTLH
jgi:hypothetical protein